jgi:hypothetical protein
MPGLLKKIENLHAVSPCFLFAGWRSEWEAPTDRNHCASLTALHHGNLEVAANVPLHHVLGIGRKASQHLG